MSCKEQPEGRKITSEHVWSAYYKLWQYARYVGVKSKLKLPVQMGKTIPTRHIGLTKQIAEQIDAQDKDYVIQCTEEYYAYLYLFVQLVRCSQKSGPYFMDSAIGWKNLAWFPLQTLKGRVGVADRTWQAWYHATIYGKRLNEADLNKTYPMLLESGESDAEIAKQQVLILNRIKKENNISTLEALLYYNLAGEMHNKKKSAWHPWLILAVPEAWDTYINWNSLPVFLELIQNNSNWDFFYETFIPLMNKGKSINKTKEALLQKLDHALNYSDLPKNTKMKWKILRRKLLKSPYAEDNRITVY